MDTPGRYEIKFVMPLDKMNSIRRAISELLDPDEHNGNHGYHVHSLYFDSPDLDWFWEKVEGERIRTKMRIRIYPEESLQASETAFVELKLKTGNIVHKRRVALATSRALDLCEGRLLDELACPDQVLCEEIGVMVHALALRPTAITSYSRMAFTSEESYSRLRITFDTSCRARIHELDLLSDATSFSFLPVNMGIMEIKTAGSIPGWLLHLLQVKRLKINRMSKYCTAVALGKGLSVLPLVSMPLGSNIIGDKHG